MSLLEVEVNLRLPKIEKNCQSHEMENFRYRGGVRVQNGLCKKCFVNKQKEKLVVLCLLGQNLKIDSAICTLAPLLLHPCDTLGTVTTVMKNNKKMIELP